MPCYKPIDAWRSRDEINGKRKIVFDATKGTGLKLQVPCGQCIGCRLERSRQWAVRCLHEASLYDTNSFITLTYAPEHLPQYGSLRKDHLQKFWKRLRKKYPERRIRYYACGEYGDGLQRPHYHACVFNHGFDDRYLWSSEKDRKLYRSAVLESLWPYGFCTIGEVTFESASYVARYILKKQNGEKALHHYMKCDPETGELHEVEPEFTTMSRRPGIGKGWYELYKGDAYPSDFIVVRGKSQRPPVFYDRMYELEDPEEYERIRRARVQKGYKGKEDQTPERLEVRERCAHARNDLKRRSYEG